MELIRLFTAGEGDYYTFRIPALVATTKGTLLAFCAARRGRGGDWDPIDIASRRSIDGGTTWEPLRLIAHSEGHTVDNPVPIVDCETGAIHFLYQIDYARVFYMRSDDDGVTWSEAREITSTFDQFRPEYDWRVAAPGPGHAIQLKNGRLLVAVWLSTGAGTEFGAGKLGHRPSCVSTIYSDDHGATWQRGEIVLDTSDEMPNPSETMPLELEDGRVMLFIRTESAGNRRAVAYSADGATGWSRPVFHPGLYEPICMASVLRMTSSAQGGKSRVLYSNPDSSANPTRQRVKWGIRENITVKLSYDDGQTWPVAKSIDPGFAGYSDLAVGPDGTIYCIYEGGGREGNMFHNLHMSVARFSLDWLTDGQDHWA